MIDQFEPFLDFWLKGQKQGFAGNLPRKKLSDGSKIVALSDNDLLYVDRWYGSELGGGQTLLYKISEPWSSDEPLQITGKPIARLGYSGRIVRRLNKTNLKSLMEIHGDISQSELIWKVLKSALSQVTRERPFRGPKYYEYPDFFVYESKETNAKKLRTGEEIICHLGVPVYIGVYDFTLIKNSLEDKL